jgi:deoxyribodipyrimidine photo-lyase
MTFDTGLVWFRRDLRLEDHSALTAALTVCRHVHCAFVFDRAILDPLIADGARSDRRVDFIHAAVIALDAGLRQRGGGLIALHDRAEEAVPRLARALAVEAVFAAEDYEPAAQARDAAVERALGNEGRRFERCKDQVVFEKSEVVTASARPYAVFTPYRTAWLRRLGPNDIAPRDAVASGRLAPPPPSTAAAIPSLEQLGFAPSNLSRLPIRTGESGARIQLVEFLSRIYRYDTVRDYPALRGPSYLSVHLRFGTVSVRTLVREALARDSDGARTWLSELIWREFYQMILWHHPHVVDHAYRPEYDAIVWETGPRADAAFAAWCSGRTGYPLVDAAMAQINTTGYMHNRLRMVVASFLTKDLGIDWRRGERYFALHLNDFDLAANNGGWQWAASTGCDAQPYFRIFNPVTQSEKFDPDGAFIKRYLPQLAGFTAREIHAPWHASRERQREARCEIGVDYPAPIVDHAEARRKTLERYAVAKR